MNWFEPIDDYCERLAPGLLAEPWNAVSNASFIVAAILLFAQWQRSEKRGLLSLLLIANVFAIGIGSLLFHTFANRWSMLADVLPITIFIHFYLLLALRTYVSLSWLVAAIVTLGFFFASPYLGSLLRPIAGSSAFYVPALFAIFAVAAAVRKRLTETMQPHPEEPAKRASKGPRSRAQWRSGSSPSRLASLAPLDEDGQIATCSRGLFIAGCVFAISIAFRAADQPFCDSLPFGTHVMWHLLNGLVLYLLVRVYLRFTSAREAH